LGHIKKASIYLDLTSHETLTVDKQARQKRKAATLAVAWLTRSDLN